VALLPWPLPGAGDKGAMEADDWLTVPDQPDRLVIPMRRPS